VLLKFLFRLLLAFIAVPIVFSLLLILFGVSNQPDLALDWQVSPADVNRAKKILREGYKIKPDQVGQIELSRADLNLATNYLLNRYTDSKALINLKAGKIRFAVSAALPNNFIGKYVNISFRLGNEDNNTLPTLTKFKTGKLLLPSKPAAWVINQLIKHSALNDYFILATEQIKSVAITDDKVTIIYHQSKASLKTARDILTHGNITNRETSIYENKLSEIIQQHDPNWRLSLSELLQPLFVLAKETANPANAIEENRTIIYLVNEYINDPKSYAKTTKPYYPAFLYKRTDLAQHYIGAAAITASSNGQLAKAMGEEKEVQDSISGSGFSFVDLAADRAGTLFGEMATASPESARKLQVKMAAVKDYKDFMPDPLKLPENMDEAAFKKRYGSMNSPAYLKVSKEIDRLITETTIFKKD
jgi:hypothetical protein